MTEVLDDVEDGQRMLGQLADGSEFELRVPTRWNGYLITQPDLWRSRSQETGEQWLTTQGFASARHSRAVRRWNVAQGLANEAELVGIFESSFGAPSQGKIVAGGSLGGLLARLIVERFPGSYVGALPQDGGGEGILGPFERGFDMAFVLSTLLTEPGERIALVTSDDPRAECARLETLVDIAAATPAGRARIALTAAVGMMVIWSRPDLPRPDVNDGEQVIDHWAHGVRRTLPPAYLNRVLLEGVVGGSFCGNAGVDYELLLERSGQLDRVLEAYDRAGLALADDLTALQHEPRILAEPGPRATVGGDLQLTGVVGCPLLVVKGLGDPDATPNGEGEYRAFLRAGGSSDQLRVAWVNGAGHVNTTVAERAAALLALVDRIESGQWSDQASPGSLNARAAAITQQSTLDLTTLGMWEEFPDLRPAISRFVAFEPRRFVRSSW